ncbi:MAG TPA: hypothetical protein VM537_15500 [Anaerolineae bacterium]|nr:hypothetical protein [Anaerolineae bacterium]
MANDMAQAMYEANPKRKPWNTPPPSREISWYALNNEDTDAVRRQAQAVHDFLGAKNLERNAVATMVAALRESHRIIQVLRMELTRPEKQELTPAGRAVVEQIQAALRSAGEEAE